MNVDLALLVLVVVLGGIVIVIPIFLIREWWRDTFGFATSKRQLQDRIEWRREEIDQLDRRLKSLERYLSVDYDQSPREHHKELDL